MLTTSQVPKLGRLISKKENYEWVNCFVLFWFFFGAGVNVSIFQKNEVMWKEEELGGFIKNFLRTLKKENY